MTLLEEEGLNNYHIFKSAFSYFDFGMVYGAKKFKTKTKLCNLSQHLTSI